MNGCMFCGKSPDTKEHVIPQWIHRKYGIKHLSIKFEVRHFLQMRMNILRWCPIPKSFAWARI